jgi:sulfate/thiosulfate transport system substrate-binding protein
MNQLTRRAVATAFLCATWTGLLASGCKKEEARTGDTAGPSTAQPPASTSPTNGSARLSVASYDPTRELYAELNQAFEKHWQDKTAQTVDVETDHDASGKQSRDIINGKPTDVAALSVSIDIDNIARAGLTSTDWHTRHPSDSVPYVSAVIFMVRKGNPKNIRDWEDLARPNVSGLAQDPKTGGGARWIYLATWCHALRKARAEGKSDAEAEQAARELTAQVYDQAILDIAMRRSSNRFIQQEEGDVLFGWENEILQIVNDPATQGKYETVIPSDSIAIEVPIAVVDKNADQHGVRELADAYVQYHFSDEGQELIARRYNRPYNQVVADRHADKLPPLSLYRFKDHFTDWPTVTKTHFAQGGELDQMRKAR